MSSELRTEEWTCYETIASYQILVVASIFMILEL